MNDSIESLPSFKNPPITEVALSVQFEPIEGLHLAYMGLLWNEVFRSRFTKFQQHPAISNVIETQGITKSTKSSVLNIQLLENVPHTRMWFINNTDTELVQIQQDRFIYNWRKIEGSDEYPRYPKIKNKFQTYLDLFIKFIEDHKLGKFIPNQCDVTYINHINSGEGWKSHNELNNVISLWSNNYSEPFFLVAEDYKFSNRYIINDNENKFLGRLHINLLPAFNIKDNKPIFSLTLTARGRPDGEGINGVLKFFDIGRENIVKGFSAITTPIMHKIWRRKDAT